MIRCYGLILKAKTGSSVPIFECGGTQLRESELLLVSASLLPSLKSYMHLFEEPKIVMCKSLRNQNYEVRKASVLSETVTIKKKVLKQQMDGLKEASNKEESFDLKKQTVEELSDNRSIINPKTRRKVRKKRVTQKAKRNEDA